MITGMGLGREVQYIEQKITELNPDKAGSNIVGLAMGIQKGNYDGTDEAFAKCTNEAGGTVEKCSKIEAGEVVERGSRQ